MFVEQKQVTAINLHDGRAREISLQRDGRGYRLCLVSQDDVVNVLLSAHDLEQLRLEIARVEGKEARPAPAKGCEAAPVASVQSATYHWNALDWISFN